jgi:CheY-like chemotaxis protein
MIGGPRQLLPMSHDDLSALVERSKKEFVASFAGDYTRLVNLADAAGAGDSAALVDLQLNAHRMVSRAGILQFLAIARHCAALETLARVDDVRHFDRGAASACLDELREAFIHVRQLVSSGPAAVQGPLSAPPPAVTRALVLVVDDDHDQRYLLTRVLQRSGFEVIGAATGTEAVALARARQPAVILLDVQMPDQDGFATGRLLKADSATSAIPLMFLSGTADPADRETGRAIGAEDYVVKTIDPRELIARVRAMCARLRLSSD